MSNCCMSVLLDNQTCQDFQMYRVSEKILDVTCNSSELVKQLVIKGPVVGHMCDLEISGGRNVALKQTATQITIYRDNINGRSEACNAVDGNRDREFYNGSCSHTGFKEYTPRWTLDLKENEKIFRIVIYNRNDLQTRLDGFILEVYTGIYGNPIYVLTSKVNTSDIYFINLPPLPSVKRIVIKKKHDDDAYAMNYLTLCEVELYKQHVCDQNHSGLYCNQSCNCMANRQCYPATGVCGTPCVAGKNDLYCNYPCYPNCLNNKCRDGKCVSCKKGFEGARCEEAICLAGKYGTNCTLNCSKNCLDSKCNKTTGHCQEKNPDDNPDDGDEFHYFYQLLLLLLLIPLCLCFFCCCFMKRRKEKPVQEEKTHKQAMTEQISVPQDLGETKDTGSSVDSNE